MPGGDSLVKDFQCYVLFGGITLKNHAFLLLLFHPTDRTQCVSLYLSTIIDSHSITFNSFIDDFQLQISALAEKIYPSCYTVCSNESVISKLRQLPICLHLMTSHQDSCLSPQENIASPSPT